MNIVKNDKILSPLQKNLIKFNNIDTNLKAFKKPLEI